ncbi:DUF924 family protein [Phyllobacterium myrsinacearum]|uniref:DUF924 domain-containing protein n=1 Tax=Phyllobacterium myrsinacearum TaxID=28101 RepID=A0A2S9JWI0_9HYPH|nr:DUF924 family protein [Phyllobacterium myrsinacearum]PRD57676.1 DUF924 domain-containing protein [Phyllobacterium myrsinacearum]PWV87263.1 uncharacterized protein (DUF924 family) [Phyllobacterium myrsinacearum]RZV10184.1 uncharacterized protein (DUF924 family) [Phyllobacterium myrsinacearum]
MAETDQAIIDGIVGFWRKAGADAWFKKDAAFDETFRQTFLDRHFAAARRDYDHWIETADGALALMILLDQFPRNCFRGTGHMYATDSLARHYAGEALERGHDLALEPSVRGFLYLPFMHSEDINEQLRCVKLYTASAPSQLEWAEDHYNIIRRFGRFPHRNAILGRKSTPEEQTFLDAGGFAG